MYAVGYFLEVGIGTPPNFQEYVLRYLNLYGSVFTDFGFVVASHKRSLSTGAQQILEIGERHNDLEVL